MIFSVVFSGVFFYLMMSSVLATTNADWLKSSYELGKGLKITGGEDSFSSRINMRFQLRARRNAYNKKKDGLDVERAWICASGHIFVPDLKYDLKFNVGRKSFFLDYKVTYSLSLYSNFLIAIYGGQGKSPQSADEEGSVWKKLFTGNRSGPNEELNAGRTRGFGIKAKFWDNMFANVGIFSVNGRNKKIQNGFFAGSFIISSGKYDMKDEVSWYPEQPFVVAFKVSGNITPVRPENMGNISSDSKYLKSLGLLDLSRAAFQDLYGNLDTKLGTGYFGLRWWRLSLATEGYFLVSSSSTGREPDGNGGYIQGGIWVITKKLLFAARYSQAEINTFLEDGTPYQTKKSETQGGLKYFFDINDVNMKHSMSLNLFYTYGTYQEKESGIIVEEGNENIVTLTAQFIF